MSSQGKHIVLLWSGPPTPEHPSLEGIAVDLHVTLDSTGHERFAPLLTHLEQCLPRLQPHTRWLDKAHQWLGHKKNNDWLLYGRARREATDWLSRQSAAQSSGGFRVNELMSEFIELSGAQQLSKRCMYHFHQLVTPVIYHTRFDGFIGATAVANPLALLPQLWVLLIASSSEAISVFMWLIFFMLQMSTTLFAIKHRNFGLCLSQFASMLITCAIIATALLKR